MEETLVAQWLQVWGLWHAARVCNPSGLLGFSGRWG